MKFSEILRNPHFSLLAALLSVPYNSLYWRQHHQHVAFWALAEETTHLLTEVRFLQMRDEFIRRFLRLLVTLTDADPKLRYSQDDLDWFIAQMEGECALTIASMLFAVASSRPVYVTPVEVAAATETAESTWRNKAAAHELIGAFKAGKQWLIPVASLRAYGIVSDIAWLGREVEEDEAEGDPA